MIRPSRGGGSNWRLAGLPEAAALFPSVVLSVSQRQHLMVFWRIPVGVHGFETIQIECLSNERGFPRPRTVSPPVSASDAPVPFLELAANQFEPMYLTPRAR
jgi:hypothetical protein